MPTSTGAVVGLLLFWSVASCTPANQDRCGKGFEYIDGGCFKTSAGDADTDGDGDADGDSGAPAANGIGAPCSCTGDGCAIMGMPIPTGGAIVGCDDVPKSWPGAVLACMRSYNGDSSTSMYFANGFCTLEASQCQGSTTVCQMAQVGSYADMTGCPKGSVMLTASGQVSTPAGNATIDNKMCAPSCSGNGDCRDSETDPVFNNEKTQYQCIDKNGTRFCDDPRNLKGDYTVTSQKRRLSPRDEEER